MPYSAIEIAVAFVKKAISESKYVTQMKLQKLVYFAHGYHLAKTGDPLIKDEVQAWDFGPVIPSIYHAFKLYGSDPIIDLKYAMLPDGCKNVILDANAQDAVDFTWNALKEVGAIKLSAWTHQDDTPWKKAYRQNIRDIVIDNKEIGKYFHEFLQKA